mgnify:CR=1 FL=1
MKPDTSSVESMAASIRKSRLLAVTRAAAPTSTRTMVNTNPASVTGCREARLRSPRQCIAIRPIVRSKHVTLGARAANGAAAMPARRSH